MLRSHARRAARRAAWRAARRAARRGQADIQAVHTRAVVSVSARMASSEDLGVVAVIAFGLTYFYWKKNQNDERR